MELRTEGMLLIADTQAFSAVQFIHIAVQRHRFSWTHTGAKTHTQMHRHMHLHMHRHRHTGRAQAPLLAIIACHLNQCP